MENIPRLNRRLVPLASLALLLMVAPGRLWAEGEQLLKADEYRGNLEEVVVVGQKPQWRTQTEERVWRPEKFELKEVEPGRIQWFPEYDKEERDQYQGIRDRMGEKPEIKIFEWKF